MINYIIRSSLKLRYPLILIPFLLRSFQRIKVLNIKKVPRLSFQPIKSYKPLLAGFLFGGKKLSDSKVMSGKVEETIQRADELYKDSKWDDLYNFLKEALKDTENEQPDVLWRMARSCREMANQSGDKEKKKNYTYEAFEHSSKGIKMDPENPDCNKWHGIMLDLTARFEGMKKRIENSYVMKEHLEKAISIRPEDATTLHSLGVWCFEVADLAWYQRKIAAALFAKPPESSYEEALKYFLQAEKVSPNFYSYNLVYLGKTYLRMSDKAKAKEAFTQCVNMEGTSAEDAEAKKEASDLLKKC